MLSLLRQKIEAWRTNRLIARQRAFEQRVMRRLIAKGGTWVALDNGLVGVTMGN